MPHLGDIVNPTNVVPLQELHKTMVGKVLRYELVRQPRKKIRAWSDSIVAPRYTLYAPRLPPGDDPLPLVEHAVIAFVLAGASLVALDNLECFRELCLLLFR